MVARSNDNAAKHALPEHLEALPRTPSHRTAFDRLICEVIGCKPTDGLDGKRDGRRDAFRRALNGKATYDQIRDWRRGKAKPPQWAVDMLAEKAYHSRQLWQFIESLAAGCPARSN